MAIFPVDDVLTDKKYWENYLGELQPPNFLRSPP